MTYGFNEIKDRSKKWWEEMEKWVRKWNKIRTERFLCLESSCNRFWEGENGCLERHN